MTRAFRLNFDWQIILFALSAVIGLVVAYNPSTATVRLALIAGGVVVYLIFANVSEPSFDSQQRSTLKTTLALLPVVITIYFLLTNDWTKSTEKLPILSPVTRWFASFQFAPSILTINPNVIGGVIAAFLLLQVEALKHSRRGIQVALIGLSLTGLILSEARGAWLALIIVASAWLVWKLAKHYSSNQRQARIMWLIVVLIVGVIGATVVIATPLGSALLGLGGQRRDIWRNSLALIGDYPLTGHGLGGFEMVYATYALLVHVGNAMHAHNVWFDIWLEQGLLGIIAFAGLVLNAIWPKPNATHWRTTALAALAVILLHGLIDDAFYGYGGTAIPLLFIPLALLQRKDESAAQTQKRQVSSVRFQPAFAVWGAVSVALIIGTLTPTGRATAAANLGAALQTRAELSVYRWPEYGLQDVVRQSGVADLKSAIGSYQAALTINPDNVTANRRLGQIELAIGQEDVGCERLERAFAAAPDQRATIQLLGECHALHSDIDRAMQLWRTIDMSEGQLTARQWWYAEYLTALDRAAQLAQAAQALSGDKSPQGVTP